MLENLIQRIRIIPDLHGCDWWKKMVEDVEDCSHIVFLGDYVDSYTLDDNSIVENLKNIISFAKEYPDKIVLLYGNHCVQYAFKHLNGYCSGFRFSYAAELYDIFNKNQHLFNFIHKIDTIKNSRFVFSHAGLSLKYIRDSYSRINPRHSRELWENSNINMHKFKNFKIGFIYSFINRAQHNNVHLDWVNRVSRYRGGSYPYGGPLWADMQETYNGWLKSDGEKDLIQIVGHTPLKHQKPYHYYDPDSNSSIHFCDLHSSEADIVLEVTKDNVIFKFGDKEEIVI